MFEGAVTWRPAVHTKIIDHPLRLVLTNRSNWDAFIDTLFFHPTIKIENVYSQNRMKLLDAMVKYSMVPPIPENAPKKVRETFAGLVAKEVRDAFDSFSDDLIR